VPSTLIVRAQDSAYEGGEIRLSADPNHSAYDANLDVYNNHFRIHSNGTSRIDFQLTDGGLITTRSSLKLVKITNTPLGIDTSLKIGTTIRDLHLNFDFGSGSDINDGYSSGITWGHSDTAQAGIYCQSSGSYGTRLIFGTTNSYANGTYARVIIDHEGKVGIGTMSPDAKLYVYKADESGGSGKLADALHIRGKLTIDDNVTSGGTANSLLNILYNGTHEYGVVMKIHSYGGDSPCIRFSHSSSAAEINSQVNTNWTVGMYSTSMTDFAITRDRGTNGWGTAVLRIDNNNYIYTSSYLNLGGGNENNASSPPRVLGFNGSDNYIRSYQTAYLNVNSATYLACLGDKNPVHTGRTAVYDGVYTYRSYGGAANSPTTYAAYIGFGHGTSGSAEICVEWTSAAGIWYRSMGDWQNWTSWKRIWSAGDSVTNAVWNDLAECRKSELREPGYAITPAGIRTTKRLEPGCRITSDTWGFALGDENDKTKMPVAISGRVLAYPARSREEYHLGDCVCSAPDGKVDIMTREEIRNWPDCIIGSVNEIPDYDEWGSDEKDNTGRDKIKVNGRIWIDIK
jgi:hypothetical protein